jgi:hypothetical protein
MPGDGMDSSYWLAAMTNDETQCFGARVVCCMCNYRCQNVSLPRNRNRRCYSLNRARDSSIIVIGVSGFRFGIPAFARAPRTTG